MAQKPTIAPLLGMEQVDYKKPPLITEETTLWRILCLGPQAETPKAVVYHRGEERCAQALAYSERSAWPCSACGVPDRDHVRLWTEDVPLADAMRTHRAQTWPGPPLPQWGVKPTHLNLSSGRRLPLTMMPKSLKYKTRI